jgi:glycosyltransferase involved in cell wall biosynthesis
MHSCASQNGEQVLIRSLRMNLENHSISAFFPAYNDAGSIGTLIRTVASLLPKLTDDYEIVVVNDGSADGTADLLNRLAQEYPFLKVNTSWRQSRIWRRSHYRFCELLQRSYLLYRWGRPIQYGRIASAAERIRERR